MDIFRLLNCKYLLKNEETVARRGFIYFKSEFFRGDRRGLLKALALLQRRWEEMSELKYIIPDEMRRMSKADL